MNRAKWSMVLPAVLVLVASGWAGSGEAQTPDWMDKVDPWVLSTAETKGTTEFLVVLREQAPLHDASSLATKEEKGELVARTLRETAARTQAPVLDELKGLGVEFRSYWVANMIWVRGDVEVARMMAERPDVMRVSANPTVRLKKVPTEPSAGPEEPATIEWGISKAGAPGAWALGFKGSGVVIAGQDTGYDWEHAALKAKYRGWNAPTSTATHDYNWHDSIHSGGGVCGANSPFPCDDDSHGTHTMGTMVGDDGAGNQVGMAPSAKWIGCRNMDQGNGTPTTYAECFQWFIAPTNLAGLNPDPTKAPHVISNSWGCPPDEGCTDPLVLKTVVENTRAAGIVVVVSAGNSGSSCGTVEDPPAIYDAAFSVGATSSSDGIASFSSRGPVTIDGSNRAKPDVSAPGVDIRSSVPGGGYASYDGTSMAGPHVAGEVALLLSAMPQWKGQVDLVEERIAHSAVPLTTSQTCGGVPGSQVPNNTFGWGRINALAAVSITDLGIEIADSPDPVGVGGSLTYIVRANNNAGIIPATGAVVTVTLSPKVSFVSASSGCAHASGVVTCDLGTIVKGVMPTKNIVVTVNDGGAIQTSGSIAGTLYDLNPGNNQVYVFTTAGSGADLRLTMDAPWTPALVGVPFTYSLTAQNLGPSAAGTVTVTDTLPAGADFLSASAGCAPASGTVTCNLGALNGGASSMVSVTVVPSNTSMTNDAVVEGDSVDPNLANNSASVTTAIVSLQPAGLEVDTRAGGGVGSNVNGVFELGERVVVIPSWLNPSGAPVAVTATAVTSFYGIWFQMADGSASYGSIGAGAAGDCLGATGDCYEIEAPPMGRGSMVHLDAVMHETPSIGTLGFASDRLLHIGDSFTDVPRDYFAYRFVETILHNGVTAGCGGTAFCPESSLTRAEMAVFVLKGKHGAAWAPPASTGGVFTDVPIDFWAGDFIEELAAEGVTSGCGSGRYCPDNRITRAEMAVFLLKALHGPTWVPAESTGTVFTDVPADYWAGDYIEELAAAGITSGCGGGSFCPESLVTRAEMAVFLTRTFALKLY